MKILKIGLLTAFLSGCNSQPENFAECILGNMPGVNNEIARSQVYQQCRSTFPNMQYDIVKGSGLSTLSKYSDQKDCVIQNAKSTLDSRAAINIKMACSCLYEKPRFKNEMCSYDQSKINYSELIEVKEKTPL